MALRELADEPRLVELAAADLADTDLLRAWRALAKIDNPGPQALAVLLQRSAEPGDLGDGARLSLGTLARRTQGELRQQALDGLAQGLAAAPRDSQSLGAALAAIGNSGAGELMPDVEPWLSDPSQGTRVQAAQALRKMPGPQASQALMDLATQDTEAYVRRSAAQTLGDRARKGVHALPPEALTALLQQLNVEPDPEARRGLIELLGPSPDPAIQAQLAAWFHKEPDDNNRRVIGGFLGARALASAR